MKLEDGTIKNRIGKAVDRCQAQIDFYERVKRTDRICSRVSQVGAFIITTSIPVVMLLALPASWSRELVQATLAVIAAILIGLHGIYHWTENYIRNAYTAEVLKSEKFKFETRSSEEYAANLDDEIALRNFVARIEGIAGNELSEWRSLLQQKTE
jgi:uncharacterized protein involved in tolerance to divalent cations